MRLSEPSATVPIRTIGNSSVQIVGNGSVNRSPAARPELGPGKCPHLVTRARFNNKWADLHTMTRARTRIKRNQMWPGPKRTGPCQYTGTDAGTGRGGWRRARAWAWFPPNARENSKYPKGTPFIPIFSYLNLSIFHSVFNVGLKYFDFF